MATRPKFATGKDANHNIPRDFMKFLCGGFETAPKDVRGKTLAYTANYCGHAVLLIDYSMFGGVLPDYYIEVKGRAAWVEVKTEEAYKEADHGMTAGELWMYKNCKIDFFFVVGEADFSDMLDALIDE